MSAIGTKRTFLAVRLMSAFGGKADIADSVGFMSAFDPKRTSASISCCSSETGLGLYQSARLSRYDCGLLAQGQA